jgi:hypothetical protein
MVVFSGATPSDKQIASQKYLKIRNKEIKEAINFLLANHTAYRGLTENADLLELIPADGILEELITDEGEDSTLIDSAFRDADRIDTAQRIHSSSGMFSLNQNNIAAATSVSIDTLMSSSDHQHFVRVTNSNQALNDWDRDYFGAAFPDLFPYGIGTPNSLRPTKVSLQQGLKHLLLLRDRRFAQHQYFTLVSFDMIAKKQGFKMLSLRMKKMPEVAVNAINVSVEQLCSLVQHQHDKSKALRLGRTVPNLPENLSSGPVQMLKAVEHCARYTFGTKEERMQMTRKVNAYIQVTIFVNFI